jgi:hypothetical protein
MVGAMYRSCIECYTKTVSPDLQDIGPVAPPARFDSSPGKRLYDVCQEHVRPEDDSRHG